jgi:nucleotide-binding universal stress UspA family protein
MGREETGGCLLELGGDLVVIKQPDARADEALFDDEEAPRSESRPRLRSVLLPMHGHRAPLSAIAMGRLLASALRAPLHVLFVWPTPIAASEVPRLLGMPKGALEGIVLDVEVGDPVERLVAFAVRNPTAMVVIEADPEEAQSEPFGVSSLAARTIAAATVPVMVVRQSPPGRLSRILLPLDGTPSTAGALGPAGELARDLRASLDIVLVGEAHHRPPHEHGSMAPPQYVDQPQHEWAAFSDEFVHRFLTVLGHCPTEVPTRFFLGAGDPAEEILRYADELGSDLTVLVWHGHVPDHCSVFRTVLRRAACPVLVLRR